jgi:hypothetical protein
MWNSFSRPLLPYHDCANVKRRSEIVPHYLLLLRARLGCARPSGLPPTPKVVPCVGALDLSKFCEKLIDMYPARRVPSRGWGGRPWPSYTQLEIALGSAAKGRRQ